MITRDCKFFQKAKQIAKAWVFIIVVLVAASSCKSPRPEAQSVDFNESTCNDNLTNSDSGLIRVSVATVISPRESFVYYKQLFDYMAQSLGVTVEYRQRNSYEEFNHLIASNGTDLAFVCSSAYAFASDSMHLLVVPEHRGLPFYRAYVIANRESDIQKFEDFKGKSFATSDTLCLTGSLFVNYRLKGLGTKPQEFFSNIYHSPSHDVSILLVGRGLIDGASVNGLILDYLANFHPKLIENIKIVEKSPYFGIPPIVTSTQIDSNLRNRLEVFFLNMHQTAIGQNILYNLNIDRFVLARDSLYDGIRKMKVSIAQ